MKKMIVFKFCGFFNKNINISLVKYFNMTDTLQKILPSDLRIEKLSNRHTEIVNEFQTYNKELKDFLVEDALANQEMAISTTYLWLYNPKNELCAYVTILADAIRIHGTKLGKSFVDQGVLYKTLPAIKIGRLCVDDRYTKRGIGKQTTYFVMKKLIHINEVIGCRFIVVDAKPDSTKFYKKMGFEVLKQREKGTLPMYYDMIKLIRYFKENKAKLSKTKEEKIL